MTVSTLDQISAYATQTQERLITQPGTVQNIQDRGQALNRELLNAIGEAEISRTQRTSVDPTSLSEETRQLVTSIAGYNSTQQSIEIYMNVMHGSDTYEADTINTANVLEYTNRDNISEIQPRPELLGNSLYA